MKQGKIIIAYIIDCITTKEGIYGGTEKQIIEIINRLDRKKFEPILICLRQNVNVLIWEKINCRKFVLSVHSLISVHVILSFLKFLNILSKQCVDIVNTYFFDATVFGVLAAKIARIGCIISSRRDMGFWYTPKILAMLKVTNLLVDRILVNSEAIKQNVIKREKIVPNKIDVIYNGIDARIFDITTRNTDIKEEIGIPLDDRIVGIVANLNRQVKRVDLFVSAADLVLKVFENVSFIIIGTGNLMPKLKRQAESLGVQNKVYFLGFKKDVISYIKGFDIGVIASDSEGFSNTILEYAAAGVAVVSTNIGGVQELFDRGDFGELVPAKDYQQLARAIIKLLGNPKRLNAISKKERKIIKKEYDWKYKIKEVEKYYTKLLNT